MEGPQFKSWEENIFLSPETSRPTQRLVQPLVECVLRIRRPERDYCSPPSVIKAKTEIYNTAFITLLVFI